jgi:hypothetical protein
MRSFSACSKSSGRSVSLQVFLPLLFLPVLVTAQTVQQIPLKNWAAPLYWSPNPTERQTVLRSGPEIRPMVTPASTTPLTLVAIAPCRLVDTRGPAAGFNGLSPFSGPSFTPSSTVTFPVQSSDEATADTTPTPCGTIPSMAQAYSFNITVIPKTAGGIAFVTIWPSGGAQPAVSTINDGSGIILANAAIVPAGTPSGGVSVINSGPASMDLIIDMNGYYAEPTNLAVVGNINFTGSLQYQGSPAFQLSGNNTAIGLSALQSDTSGFYNTAVGYESLFNNVGGVGNTATGSQALEFNQGNDNTAVGFGALQVNNGGSGNVAIGYLAAANVSASSSNNIHIGSQGISSDNAVTRIGTFGTQTAFYAAGANANLGGDGNAVGAVVDTTTGQVGVVSSSRRYKQDIEDMGDASRGLMDLRPVTYRYKQPFADGSNPIQYGLIAEEVAEVYPDLVAHTADGRIETVKYQVLDSMLLNEVQRQQAEIRGLEQQNRSLQERLEKLETVLTSLSGASRAATAAPVVP